MQAKRRARQDPEKRDDHARDALGRWLYKQHTDQGIEWVELGYLLNVSKLSFERVPITGDTVLRAVDYLWCHNLAWRGQTTSESGAVAQFVRLTPRWDDYVRRKLPMSEFLYPQLRPRSDINFRGEIGEINGSFNPGQNLYAPTVNGSGTQHNTNGLDVAEVARFARAVQGSAPELGLQVDDLREILIEATRLSEEAASGQPQAGRMRALGRRIHVLLGAAPNSIASQAILTSFSAVIGALLGG